MAINQISIDGNLGGDAVMKTSKTSGTPYCEFSVAHKRQENTMWFKCQVFGKSASVAAEKLKKGDKVYVSGSFEYKLNKTIPNDIPYVEIGRAHV